MYCKLLSEYFYIISLLFDKHLYHISIADFRYTRGSDHKNSRISWLTGWSISSLLWRINLYELFNAKSCLYIYKYDCW